MCPRSTTPAKRCIGLTWLCAAGACVILLCVALLLSAIAGGKTVALDFEAATVGRLSGDFTSALTGRGQPGVWRVLADPTTSNGGKVLAQTSSDKTSYRFPLCLYEPLTTTDATVSVRFKAVAGTVDQAAGLVVRFTDHDNYYVVRANALENNVRLYKVERGNRKQFAGRDVEVPAGQWQRLSLDVKGTHFRVLLNDTLLFEADDTTFRNAGKVGLWTKADSVTYFDNLTIANVNTP